MATTFKRIGKGYLKAAAPTPPTTPESTSLDLLGIDVLTNHMHVKGVFLFPATLNPAAVKEGLAKVLAAHPVLGGRVRTKGNRVYVDWGEECSALVYEQRALVYGGEEEGSSAEAMKKYGQSFARGPINHAINDDRAALVIMTLTDIEYRENASPWTCRPAAYCQPEGGFGAFGLAGDQSDEEEGQQAGEEEEKLIARYAVGFAISHDIADGCSIAQFLMAMAHATMKKPIPPSVHDRSLLLGSLPDLSVVADMEMHPGYRIVGTVEKAVLMTSMMFGIWGCDFVRLCFPKEEVDAIKAKAMEPLEGTEEFVSSSNALAAHLWPILTELMRGDGGACKELYPYSTAVNHRKLLGLPPNYFGNLATFTQAEPATVDESLTELALKIRRAGSTLDPDAVKKELTWMQNMLQKGKLSRIMVASMLDAFAGRPFLGWDDVSGFVPPNVPGVVLCGVPSVRIDLPFVPLPGIALVLPNVEWDGSVGKDVLIALKKKAAADCLSPEYQARIHAFAVKKKGGRESAQADHIVETKEMIMVDGEEEKVEGGCPVGQ